MINLKFTKGLIDSNAKTITVWLSTPDNQKQEININVASPENDCFVDELIDMANRHYAATIFNIEKSEEIQEYGCINSKVLGLKDIPLTIMNTKYLINIFLNLVECLFTANDTQHLLPLCARDKNSVQIPTTEHNISNLINDIIYTCATDHDEDEYSVDIKDLFLTVLHFMSNLSANNAKKINNSNVKKKLSMAGGIPNIHQIFGDDFLKDNINQALHQTGDMIHNMIREYRNLILHKVCKDDFQAILNVITANPNLVLYQNTNISYKFMMNFICNLFNKLFLEILPKTTMINCLYASLYQASVLNELNILKYHSKYIQMPIIYKLIYSFYKCDYHLPNQSNIDQTLSGWIDRLCQKEIDSIDILCNIAIKINIQDENQLNVIFWLLNEKRGYTYEFYIILMISLYVMSRCQTMNKHNKLLNSKSFIKPLYEIISGLYIYVVSHINNIDMALCDETLDNFSKMYSSEIMHCFKKLSTTMVK